MPDMHAPRPEPHDEPWYLRLLKLGRRAEHPTPLDPELADAGSQADADMKRQQAWQEYFRLAADRNERYRIFGDMDYGSAAAIADLYAEEATQVDYDKRLTVWVDSADADTKKSVEQCLVNTVAEDTATSICRAFCVMGDHYRRVAYGTGTGVFGWRGVKPGDVSRVEDAIGRLVGFKETGKKFRGALKRDVSWPWDYVHFRLPGKYDETGYGTSAFDTMFLPWRQLTLAEDSKLTYMVRRAPDRNAVMVDVGDLDDAEAMEYVNRWRKSMRKQELIDPAAPGYKKQFNPLTPFEDLFIPTRGGDTASRIETLAGSGAADQVYDLNYFRDKFYGSGRVPKSYMGVGDQAGGDSAKATLVRQDVRFARLIMRIQRAYRSGMRSACDLDLVLKGADPDKLPKYLLQMAPISYLAELERLEVVRMRIELLEAMANLATTLNLDSKAWAVYILSEYGRLPDEIVKRVTAKAAAPAGQEGGKSEGAYPLNKEEKRMIHEAMLRSAGLRHAVSFIVEANAGETPDGQRDPTILEPLLSGSRTQIGDRGDQHKMLMEDILTFRAKETKEQVNG